MPTPCSPRRPLDGRRLRAIREARGITRQRLATAADISLRTLAGAELGHSQPVPAIVAALAAALGVERDALTTPEKDDDPAVESREAVKRRVSADDSR